MFLIFPWKVDVLQDRRPVMNWLVILATIIVFWLQIADSMEHEGRQNTARQSVCRPEPSAIPSFQHLRRRYKHALGLTAAAWIPGCRFMRTGSRRPRTPANPCSVAGESA